MNFLRLLSQNGYQNFTYTCINSAAWFNSKSNSYDMAVKFMGQDSVEFSSEPGSSPKVDVLVDGCKVCIISIMHYFFKPKTAFSMCWFPTLFFGVIDSNTNCSNNIFRKIKSSKVNTWKRHAIKLFKIINIQYLSYLSF